MHFTRTLVSRVQFGHYPLLVDIFPQYSENDPHSPVPDVQLDIRHCPPFRDFLNS